MGAALRSLPSQPYGIDPKLVLLFPHQHRREAPSPSGENTFVPSDLPAHSLQASHLALFRWGISLMPHLSHSARRTGVSLPLQFCNMVWGQPTTGGESPEEGASVTDLWLPPMQRAPLLSTNILLIPRMLRPLNRPPGQRTRLGGIHDPCSH